MLLGALVGILLGYGWGREVILRSAQERLESFAENIRASNARSAAEARQVLRQINAVDLPPCSHQELEVFRKLIYGSQFLKDAGRSQNGTLQCSAVLGKLKQPLERLGTGFIRPDGTRAYRNLAPYRVSGKTVVAIQSGNGIVVYNPYNLRSFIGQPMHFTVIDRDINTGAVRILIGNEPPSRLGRGAFLTSGATRSRSMLYATRCNPQYSGCVTTYIAISDVLRAQAREFRIYLGLSAACGVLLSLVIFMLYRRSSSMEQQLRRAIRRNELGVAYQPIVDMETGAIIAAEALARWRDEDGVDISPEIFIKLAEDRGFVGQITRVVVDQAVRALQQTRRIQPEFSINVNVSAVDLDDLTFPSMVRKKLESTGCPARYLGFEMTERSWAEWDSLRETLQILRERGHWIFIDDFGTGYSSLASLHNLPVDVLKIDKEFSHSIGTQSVKVAIVPQILALAAALKLKVIVEGIETEEQAQYFAESPQQLMAQGWYFGRPMPLESLLTLLHSRQTAGNVRDPFRSQP